MNIENMIHYQLNKGENLDIDGRNLYSYLHSIYNASNVKIVDSSGTIQNMSGLFNCLPEWEFDWEDEKYMNMNSIDISELNSSNVTDMSYLFDNCYRLTNLSNFNTSKVTNMSHLFSSCTSLINIPSINTFNVVDMSNMFYRTTNIDFSTIQRLDTSNVTNMTGMFAYSNLRTLPSLDTSKVINFNHFVAYCNLLTDVSALTNYDLNNCVNFSTAFYTCESLNNIPDLYLPNVDSISECFSSCKKLVKAPNIYAPKLTKGLGHVFSDCINLIHVPEYNFPNMIFSISFMFMNDNKLSDASIQNIINMCLNLNSFTGVKNLSNTNTNSPFYKTNISNTRYQNRWSELTQAGWHY